MALEIEATYENGVLRLPRELPLEEGSKVKVTIYPPGHGIKKGFGPIPRNGRHNELEPSSVVIPTGVRLSKSAFFRDLPKMLKNKKLKGKWVLYHGKKRVGIATTQLEIRKLCLAMGFRSDECYDGKVIPQVDGAEEIDGILFEVSDGPDSRP